MERYLYRDSLLVLPITQMLNQVQHDAFPIGDIVNTLPLSRKPHHFLPNTSTTVILNLIQDLIQSLHANTNA